MKKIFIFGALAFGVSCFSSCNMKHCYCYELVGDNMTETESYVDMNQPCSNLTTYSRTCVEEGERMDPGQIAWK